MASLGGTSLVKSVMLVIKGDSSSADDAITRVAAAAEALKQSMPELAFAIDREKLFEQATIAKALLRSQFSDAIKIPVDVDTSGSKLGGLLSSATKGISGLLGGIPLVGSGLAGAAGTNPAAAAGVLVGTIAAASALAVAVDAVASGLAASAIGLGAFAALAKPTFTSITGEVTTIQADMAALAGAHGIAGIITLQQAQSAAAQKLKADWQLVDPAQQQVVRGIIGIENEYQKMSLMLEPITTQLLDTAVKIANELMPVVQPFAIAAGNALGGLAKQAEKFFASADFKKWARELELFTGPAITEIGQSIGQVAIAAGKLLVLLSSPDNVRTIRFVTDAIIGLLELVAGQIWLTSQEWKIFETAAVKSLEIVLGAAVLTLGWIPGLGPQLRQAQANFDQFATHVLGDLAPLQGAGEKLGRTIAGVAQAIGGLHMPGAGLGPGAGKIAGLAAGGWASGLTLVGENGPELLSLPSGSYVYSNAATAGLLAGLGGAGRYGGGMQVQVQLSWAPGSEGAATMALSQLIRAEVTAKGGGGVTSVQRTFGKVS